MTVELPEEPENRKETYLAYIAGQEIELPEEPANRIESYLAYIAENGSGGGGGGGGDAIFKPLGPANYNYDYGNTGENNCIDLAKIESGYYRIAAGTQFYMSPEAGRSVVSAETLAYYDKQVSPEDTSMYLTMFNDYAGPDIVNIWRIYQDYDGNNRSVQSDYIARSSALEAFTETFYNMITTGSAPDSSYDGIVGQLLEDIDEGALYQCTNVDEESDYPYTWTQVGHYSVFYLDDSVIGSISQGDPAESIYIYKDADLTAKVTGSDIYKALASGTIAFKTQKTDYYTVDLVNGAKMPMGNTDEDFQAASGLALKFIRMSDMANTEIDIPDTSEEGMTITIGNS